MLRKDPRFEATRTLFGAARGNWRLQLGERYVELSAGQGGQGQGGALRRGGESTTSGANSFFC